MTTTKERALPARVTGAQPSARPSAARAAAPMIGALVLLATVQLMVVLDTTIVNVALPTIQGKVGFSTSGIAWVVNGYALTFGALLLLGGRSGVAQSPDMLIGARVLQGAAAAFAQATALALIVSTFTAGKARNRAVGVFAAMEGLGAGAGLLLGGVIVEYISWRWVFLVNVPVAVVVALLAPRFIPATARERTVIDLPGAATASISLGLLVFGLSRAADHGWTALLTAGPIAAGLLGILGFVFLESVSKRPLMPLWVFNDRNRGSAYLIQALMGASLFGMFFLSTLFLQRVLGYSPLKAGAAFVPSTVFMMVGAGSVSKLVARTGVRPLIAVGTATASVGLFWLSNLTPDSAFVTGVMFPLILLSLGLGITFVPATLAAVSGVDEEHSGLVSGVSTTAIQIGGAIGLAILATVAATTTGNVAPGTSMPEALTAGYTRAFAVAGIIIALAVPIALAFLRLKPTAEDTKADDAEPEGQVAAAL